MRRRSFTCSVCASPSCDGVACATVTVLACVEAPRADRLTADNRRGKSRRSMFPLVRTELSKAQPNLDLLRSWLRTDEQGIPTDSARGRALRARVAERLNMADPAVVEPTDVEWHMAHVGGRRMAAITAIRARTGCGHKAAREALQLDED